MLSLPTTLKLRLVHPVGCVRLTGVQLATTGLAPSAVPLREEPSHTNMSMGLRPSRELIDHFELFAVVHRVRQLALVQSNRGYKPLQIVGCLLLLLASCSFIHWQSG